MGDNGLISSARKLSLSAGAERAVVLGGLGGEFSIVKIVFCGGAERVIPGGVGSVRFSELSFVTIWRLGSLAGSPRQ